MESMIMDSELGDDFEETVRKKYEVMKSKNEYVWEQFPDLPSSETVIQNYRCTFHRGEQSLGGKVYLTQNYLLFVSSNNVFRTQFSYMEIQHLLSQAGFLGYTSRMILKLEAGLDVALSGFFHYTEALTLLRYLTEHAPCYYRLPEPAERVRPPTSPPEEVAPDDLDSMDGRWGEWASSFSDASLDTPDIRLLDECLDLAENIFSNGIHVRTVVHDNAEALDRVERSVDETEFHTKKAQRELDAMRSVSGQIKKSVLGAFDKDLGAYEAPDRSAQAQEEEQFYDVPALIKHPNDSLEPCVIRFGERHFMCMRYPEQSGTGRLTLIENHKYIYHDVANVRLRVRPQHIDIRFWKDEIARLRFVSAHVQMIVNEFVLRTNRRVPVIFEPGVRKFGYGDEWLRRHPLQSTREKESGASEGLFKRQTAKASDLIQSVPPSVKADVEKYDQGLETLQRTVDNIRTNSRDTRQEMDRQSAQMTDIHKKTDKALSDMNKQNHSAQQLL